MSIKAEPNALPPPSRAPSVRANSCSGVTAFDIPVTQQSKHALLFNKHHYRIHSYGAAELIGRRRKRRSESSGPAERRQHSAAPRRINITANTAQHAGAATGKGGVQRSCCRDSMWRVISMSDVTAVEASRPRLVSAPLALQPDKRRPGTAEPQRTGSHFSK
ncbi:hypothetical protein EYF80_052207 [Liparis tanakae]|uniref:Uncharacterized protein n=1 Tax=Liparis tanakae TaxID=230148 RepID=A0A4Z2F8R7_9TELE|nr:hypothetical protein EYF80_052207 [Liparis tanakae]